MNTNSGQLELASHCWPLAVDLHTNEISYLLSHLLQISSQERLLAYCALNAQSLLVLLYISCIRKALSFAISSLRLTLSWDLGPAAAAFRLRSLDCLLFAPLPPYAPKRKMNQQKKDFYESMLAHSHAGKCISTLRIVVIE